MLSLGIVGLQHAVAHMYQTGDPQAKRGPRSLNFNPQPSQHFWNSSGLYLRIKANDGICHVITFSLFLLKDILFSGSFHCDITIITSQSCWLRINVIDCGRKLELGKRDRNNLQTSVSTNVYPHPIYFVLYFFLLAVYPKIRCQNAFISLPLPNPCVMMSKGHCSGALLKYFLLSMLIACLHIFCNVLSAIGTHFCTLVLFDCACEMDHQFAIK